MVEFVQRLQLLAHSLHPLDFPNRDMVVMMRKHPILRVIILSVQEHQWQHHKSQELWLY